MNREECQKLVTSYLDWLRSGLSALALEGACELTTPFLDRHNDHIQVYASKRNGTVVLSDDGYTLSDLKTSGLDVISPKRKAVLQETLAGFGIKIEQGRLVAEASQKNLGQKLHSLIQAMLAVNDMFVMAQPRVASFFWEDVRNYLEEKNVRYSPRVKLTGRTGYDHAIDFLIPKSRTRPERLVQAINAPNKNTIGHFLFALTDTREGRGPESEAYAFLNDRDRVIGGDVFDALDSYQVRAVAWTHREEQVAALAE